LAWRPLTEIPGIGTRAPVSAQRLVRAARTATSVLWLVALAALLAAGAEVWRYVLLVLGRDRALSGDLVRLSDIAVNTAALLAAGSGLVALTMVLRWLFAARLVAAGQADQAPARPDWQVLLGVLLPGLNLVIAGSILAELENAALGHAAAPRPSRLVLAWWLTWAVGEVLALTTIVLGLRTGVQARADGVLWHAATDLGCAGLAGVTVVVVTSLTMLIVPGSLRTARRAWVVRVDSASVARRARPTGAVR
jgi:hypothetical protein